MKVFTHTGKRPDLGTFEVSLSYLSKVWMYKNIYGVIRLIRSDKGCWIRISWNGDQSVLTDVDFCRDMDEAYSNYLQALIEL